MRRKIFGVFAILMAILAGGVVLPSLFRKSMAWGWAFTGICGIGAIGILLLFCAKCPGKHDCGHILPGRVVRHLHRPEGPYSALELSFVGASVVLMIFFPAVGLWGEWKTLLIDGVLIGLAGLGVVAGRLCSCCHNRHCPVSQCCHRKAALETPDV